MKTSLKTTCLSVAAGAVLVLLQVCGNTARADYRGYWADEVRNYQNSYQDGQAADYQPPADAYQAPMYQEQAYQPAAQDDRQYAPAPISQQAMVGKASYYADQYQGRPTASGETYDMYAMTAAHPSLPFGTPLRVTNVRNGNSVVVRVNDRGPLKGGRILDVSKAAAEQLGLVLYGSGEVQVEVLG